MDLIIVRHAEAHCNTAGVIAGEATCTGLTGRGRSQAALLGARLAAESAADLTLDAVYASPRRRAVETSTIANRQLAAPLHVVDDLRDPDYGSRADGKPWADILANRPADLTQPLVDGGEPWSLHVTRVHNALMTIVQTNPNGRALVVAHAETVKAAHIAFTGWPREHRLPIKIAVSHTGRTTWRRTDPAQRWTLVSHSRTDHLNATTPTTPAAAVGFQKK